VVRAKAGLCQRHSAIPYWTLQRPDLSGLEETTLAQYQEVYEAFFDERKLIPAGRLHEIAYQSLVAEPIETLRDAYGALRLPDFSVAEPRIRAYLATIKDYERNRFADIESPWKQAVATRWRRSFDEWGYAV
jgi:hypothetical protein